MRAISGESLDKIYKEIMAILLSGLSEKVFSTKGENLELRNIVIELSNIDNYKLNFKNTLLPERQEKYEKYLADELNWYMNGGPNETHYRGSPAPKVWKQYANNKGKIVSNYGYMILREKRTFGIGKGKK